MTRDNFHKVSTLRLQEADALLTAGHYPGAYYLIGYAVECALKACVAKQVKQYDFPDKKLANEAFTHDLEELIRVAGLAPDFETDRNADPELDLNWAIVKDWSETARYEVGITEHQARELYTASTGRNGVLPWVRKRW
jgi:HEPN domain-containing protein